MTKSAYSPAIPFFYDPTQNDENSARAYVRTIDWSQGNPVSIKAPLIDIGLFTCQTMFVDNVTNNNFITITFCGLPYRVRVKANTQGFFPVLMGGDTLEVEILSNGTLGTTTMTFINVAMVGEMMVWTV